MALVRQGIDHCSPPDTPWEGRWETAALVGLAGSRTAKESDPAADTSDWEDRNLVALAVQRALATVLAVLALAPWAGPRPWADVPESEHLVSHPADFSRGWAFARSGYRCQLQLDIGDYGVVRFIGAPGQPLRFEVIGHRDLFLDGPVAVHRRTPSWHPEHPWREPLGSVAEALGGGLSAADPLASEILLALYGGFEAELSRGSRFAPSRPVSVMLTNRDLRRHYGPFVDCYRGPELADWSRWSARASTTPRAPRSSMPAPVPSSMRSPPTCNAIPR